MGLSFGQLALFLLVGFLLFGDVPERIRKLSKSAEVLKEELEKHKEKEKKSEEK